MSNFSNIWTQSNCLSKSQLINYILQKLDRDEVYLVESHLNDCELCSDALDGLMDENIETTQTQIAAIKTETEDEIRRLHSVEKSAINIVQGSKQPTEKTTLALTGKSQKKYRWLVAASILAVVGLGGYSVYSYIKSHEQELAKNESSSEGAPATYNQPNDINSNEISRLRINPPDSFIASPSKESATEKKTEPVQPGYKESKKGKEPASVAIHQDEIMQPAATTKALAPVVPAQKNEHVEKANADQSVEPGNGMTANYNENLKAVPPQRNYQTNKKSRVGLINSKPAAVNQNARELTYPAKQNNTNYQDNEVATEEKNASANELENKLSDYEYAMQYYNNGDYKKSIRYFEKALNHATGEQKEDIQFQLAQAYLKTGKNKKAENLFEILASGSKYKSEANQELLKAKK